MANSSFEKIACTPHRLREGLLTLLFFLLLLRCGNWIADYFFRSEHASYYGHIAARCASYGILIAICIKHFGVQFKFDSNILTYPGLKETVLFTLLGISLAGFMLSQEAVEVYILSLYDVELAYAHWSFPQNYSPAWRSLDIDFALEIAAICVIGPVAEEIFFRGVLLKLLRAKYRMITATSIVTIIFLAMHPKNPHLIATMAFSIILSHLYIRTGSLGLCSIAHSAFNLTALLIENIFWPWLLMSPYDFDSTKIWVGIYVTLIFITLIILYFCNLKKMSAYSVNAT